MVDKKFKKYHIRQINYLYEGWYDGSFSKEQQLKIIGDVLFYAYARKNGHLKHKFSYNLAPPLADLIIDELSEAVIGLAEIARESLTQKEKIHEMVERVIVFAEEALRLLPPKKNKKEFPPEGFIILATAHNEIYKLYQHIKKEVGFTYRVGEDDWKRSALSYFDKNRNSFNLIKREYIEDQKLYLFSGGQESRDFEKAILQKVFRNEGLGKWGKDFLVKIRKNMHRELRKKKSTK